MNRTIALLAGISIVTLWFVISSYAPRVAAEQQTDAATTDRNRNVQNATEQPQENTLSDFMRQKLAASNQILEGLVVDDLSLVVAGSDTLLKMSAAEKWRASNDMMYLQHSRDFRQSVETLRSKAQKRSIDGAALAWVDATMSCIQCHEWVRNVIVADRSSGLTSPQVRPAK